MIFSNDLYYVSLEKRTSKKGNTYYIASFLTKDNKYFSCMSDFFDTDGFEKLQPCVVDFNLTVGRYINLKVLKCNKVK